MDGCGHWRADYRGEYRQSVLTDFGKFCEKVSRFSKYFLKKLEKKKGKRMEVVSVLSSWQGVIVAAIISIAVIALIFLLLKNADAIKGLRVTRDGVHFEQIDLSSAIPRIDANVRVKLQSVIKDIVHRALAVMDISEYKFSCAYDTDGDCGTISARQKIMKMLLVSKVLESLYDSVTRNHQVKALAVKAVDKWVSAIIEEISEGIVVIEDYCNIDLPNDSLLKSVEKIIREFYVPRAKTILTDGILAKQEVYQKLPDSDKRKEKLLSKCDDYIEGLTD
jgi:hypothetical protein